MAVEWGDSRLPSFQTPPIAEVAVTLQYAKPLPVGLQQLLTVQRAFADRYPSLEEHPPLPRLLADDGVPRLEVIELSGPYLPRVFFVGSPTNDLVQFQPDRLAVNWRKVEDNDEYLRFTEHVRPSILDAHERLLSALSDLSIEEPEIDAFEVVYVNPIELQTEDQFSTVLAQLSPSGPGLLRREPVALQMQFVYPLELLRGSLLVEVRSALRKSDDARIVLMTLTARGAVDGTFANFVECVDVAREHIVRGFTDITTNEMHARWGRQS